MAGIRNNALSLLLHYDSDSDKDSGYTSEEDRKRKNTFLNLQERDTKRTKTDFKELKPINKNLSAIETFRKNLIKTNELVDKQNSLTHSERLIPLPEEFLEFSDHVDDPSQHEGRVRSFSHERGNWASILYIPLSCDIFKSQLNSLVATVISTSSAHSLKLLNCFEYHVSLSLTFILRLEWIQPLIEDLRNRLSKCKKFSMLLYGLEVFCNEERTRTFLAIKVCHGKNEMKEITAIAAGSLKKYKIASISEDWSFHVSIAWCAGDKREEMKHLLPLLQNIYDQYFDMESDLRGLDVTEIFLKTGNKFHNFMLKPI